MRLLFVGCEYAGTTTLANGIDGWAREALGSGLGLIHDHWKIPHTSGHPDNTTPEEQEMLLALGPKLLEMHQRHSLYYHSPKGSAPETDGVLIGYHIEDTIYARLIFGYGGEGSAGNRTVHSKVIEHLLLQHVPETVLVHVKATPEAIKQRMKENPHAHALVNEDNVDLVLQAFDEAVRHSAIGKRIELDTSSSTVDESVAELVQKMEPNWTQRDQVRLIRHQLGR
jgi:hypothetical protein